jgi:hypothetical protein
LCLYSHIELVFQQFESDEYGLKMEDVDRKDRQNLGATQRLCQARVRSCLARMRHVEYLHRERTLGTEYYLEICANYIDIFCSPRLDLCSRIVLCRKVSFFFEFGDCGSRMEMMGC